MKLKISDLINSQSALADIVSLALKPNYSLRVARFIKLIQTELTNFEEERKKLIDKYGKKDEQGELIKKGDNVELNDPDAFNKEYFELLNEEVSFPDTLKKLKLSDIGVNIKPSTVLMVEWLFEDLDSDN